MENFAFIYSFGKFITKKWVVAYERLYANKVKSEKKINAHSQHSTATKFHSRGLFYIGQYQPYEKLTINPLISGAMLFEIWRYVNTNFNIKMYPVMMALNFMKNPKDVSISDIYKTKTR